MRLTAPNIKRSPSFSGQSTKVWTLTRTTAMVAGCISRSDVALSSDSWSLHKVPPETARSSREIDFQGKFPPNRKSTIIQKFIRGRLSFCPYLFLKDVHKWNLLLCSDSTSSADDISFISCDCLPELSNKTRQEPIHFSRKCEIRLRINLHSV